MVRVLLTLRMIQWNGLWMMRLTVFYWVRRYDSSAQTRVNRCPVYSHFTSDKAEHQ